MTKQIETATVVANITNPGNGVATVTGAYIAGSPVSVNFAVLLGDNEDATALAARYAIALTAAIADQYQVSGTSDVIILTDRFDRADDTSLNIATSDGTCTGITAAATSADTQAGSGLSNAYATMAEFKTYATVRGATCSTDANDDTAITYIINHASRYIDGQCRRRFYYNTVDETRYYTPDEGDMFFVDDLATDPTSVHGDEDWTRTYGTTYATSDYDLMPLNSIADGFPYTWIQMAPHASDSFPTIQKGIRVIGKFGFPAVPDDIKEACLGISLNIYQSRSGQSSAGNISVTSAGVVIRPEDVPGWAKETFNKYRKIT